MSIVNSSYRSVPASSTSQWIYESHTDHEGRAYELVWLADGHDIDARLAQHAAELADRLVAHEIDEVLSNG